MKTAELTGPLLDYWVAKAEGMRLFRTPAFDVAGDRWQWTVDGEATLTLHQCPVAEWKPSTDPAQGQPIIERERITTDSDKSPEVPGDWVASCGGNWLEGPTALIAAMRAYVASKYGEEVPDEAKP